MLLMLPSVYINGDLNRPVITVTDKDYGRTAHFKPHHTEAELRMMGPEERICAVDFDKWHKKSHLSVEDSFAQQVTKFPHTE
jgi:hypothetical protein